MHHSYLGKVQGCRFCLEAFDETGTVAVIIIGRPISPQNDDGRTAEITRLCCGPTAGYATASNLIKRAVRACKAMGYRRVQTYCDEGNAATAFVMSNFKLIAREKRKAWHQRPFRQPSNATAFVCLYVREI